jgi:hypothetical protein
VALLFSGFLKEQCRENQDYHPNESMNGHNSRIDSVIIVAVGVQFRSGKSKPQVTQQYAAGANQ